MDCCDKGLKKNWDPVNEKPKFEGHRKTPMYEAYSDTEERAKDLRKYNEQVASSDGFEVDFFPKLNLFGGLAPLTDLTDKNLHNLANLAIDEYNVKMHAEYKLVRILNGTFQIVSGVKFRLTFQAKEADADAKTFQAYVFKGIPSSNIQVLFCRLKTDN